MKGSNILMKAVAVMIAMIGLAISNHKGASAREHSPSSINTADSQLNDNIVSNIVKYFKPPIDGATDPTREPNYLKNFKPPIDGDTGRPDSSGSGASR